MGTEVVIKVRERSRAKVENHQNCLIFKNSKIPKSVPNFNSKMDLNPKKEVKIQNWTLKFNNGPKLKNGS